MVLARRNPHAGPLGASLTPALLHDGSAATTGQAILRHGGEASAVADRFRRLRPDEKALVFAFLDSL